jgi:hypothetical protein
MRVSIGALGAALATLIGASSLQAQNLRPDSYKWYIGAQAGGLWFETQTQTMTGIPSVGVHALIMAKRGGLMLEFNEAFGSEEQSAYGDSNAPNGTQPVKFDRLRKYAATLMAFPLQSRLEPYLGLGFGILHTVNTSVEGFFTSPEDAATATEEAKNRGSTGFAALLGGVQYRVSPRFQLFAQYQITTAPASGKLLVGPTHAALLGIRLGLGDAREGVKGGGY